MHKPLAKQFILKDIKTKKSFFQIVHHFMIRKIHHLPFPSIFIVHCFTFFFFTELENGVVYNNSPIYHLGYLHSTYFVFANRSCINFARKITGRNQGILNYQRQFQRLLFSVTEKAEEIKFQK